MNIFLLNKEEQDYIKQNPKFIRPAEVDYLLGDPRKAEKILGWKRNKTPFKKLVNILVSSDLERLKRGDQFE